MGLHKDKQVIVSVLNKKSRYLDILRIMKPGYGHSLLGEVLKELENVGEHAIIKVMIETEGKQYSLQYDRD